MENKSGRHRYNFVVRHGERADHVEESTWQGGIDPPLTLAGRE